MWRGWCGAIVLAAGGAALSGCGDADGGRAAQSRPAVPPAFLIRPHAAEWPVEQVLTAVAAEPVEVVGEVRQAFRITAGAELTIGLPRLPASAWLDVAVATLADDAPGLPRGAAPPTPRLIVAREVAGRRTVLFDGFPSPGRPPAFGWAAMRLELRDHLDVASLLHFRAEPAATTAAGGGADSVRFALAVPRIAPRVTARERGAACIEWRGTLTGPLPSDATVANWLAAPGARVEPTAVDAPAPLPADHPAHALLIAGIERERLAFGPVELADDLLRSTRDRWCRFDPWGAAEGDPAVAAALALGFAREVVVERGRLLGEHLLFTELARPRRSPLDVRVATRLTPEQAEAALVRLAGFLAANELIDRVVLRVQLVEAGGGASVNAARAWWRWPVALGAGALPAE
ncbi:MAG: hypothetical protein FJ293_13945 [Planctomycetes bacterium]|nr:hypothetical protein [Planctomycetota bacterium]